MTLVWFMLILVPSLGLVILAPSFFRAIAAFNASIGFPEMRAFLPRFFKIAFWISLAGFVVSAVAMPFLDEEMLLEVLQLVVAAVAAVRFWFAAKTKPIQPPVPTRGNGA